ALAGAALVVTGEGSLDRQTLSGKAPAGVARAAAAKGIPCVAVSGRCQLSSVDLAAAGISAAYALTDLEPDPARCMADAAPLLRRRPVPAAQGARKDAVGGVADAEFAGGRQDFSLDAAGEQRILDLEIGDRVHGGGAAQGLHAHFGQSDVADVAGAHQLGQRA